MSRDLIYMLGQKPLLGHNYGQVRYYVTGPISLTEQLHITQEARTP